MAKLVFFCHDTRANIDLFDYYTQDRDALRALGHEVLVCTRYRDIPREFDLLFVWWWTYALFPVLLARLRRRPVIVTGTYNFRFPKGFQGVDYFARPLWQRFLIAAATRLSTLNLFVNQREMEGCIEHFGLRNARYMPHVVASDCLQGPGPERTLSIFNIAWSGRQNLIRKGLPELVSAVGLLKDDFPDLKLQLAGKEGDGAGWLRELVEQHGLSSRVEWCGPLSREQKIRCLRTAEIYVQPSHYEGFGLAIAEAMGSGGCIITCDVGAVRTVVGDCGIYVSPGAPADLADAIRSVLIDVERRRQLQAQAVARARREFAFETKVRNLQNFLREVGVS